MTKTLQVYYNTVFGAIGGLLAWFFVGMVTTSDWEVYIANMAVGAGIGLFIGAALGMVEGLVIKQTLRQTLVGGFLGGVAGTIGGAFGLLLGGFVFVLIGGGLIARMAGWMLLGFALGLGQGVISLKLKRASYGLIGGTLAGLVGGALYELFTQTFLDQSAEAQVYLSAVGLVLIGTSLGSIIPLSVDAIARAAGQHGLIVILTGDRANREITIIGAATVGSSDACDVYLPDRAVDKKQAAIIKEEQGFVIHNQGNRSFMVNQIQVLPNERTLLTDSAKIQMGETLMNFRTR